MGTPQIAVDFLTNLEQSGVRPHLIVTIPDRPVGRKKTMTPPPVKEYADMVGITCIQAETLDEVIDNLVGYDFFCVFAYSELLKERHLSLPSHGVVNLHPSLLPQYRGAAPIMQAILDDTRDTGITLMKLERGMDSGPIIAQREVRFDSWGKWYLHEHIFATHGATLFIDAMPRYLSGELTPVEQNHEAATYCEKIEKKDMEISLSDKPYTQYRTYCAFVKPFFVKQGKRYIITDAVYDYDNDAFIISRVIPEGKQERDFKQSDIEN